MVVDISNSVWLSSSVLAKRADTINIMKIKVTNDTSQKSSANNQDQDLAEDRTDKVSTMVWTVAFGVAFVTLGNAPTWTVAFGVPFVALMVAVVCCSIMKFGRD